MSRFRKTRCRRRFRNRRRQRILKGLKRRNRWLNSTPLLMEWHVFRKLSPKWSAKEPLARVLYFRIFRFHIYLWFFRQKLDFLEFREIFKIKFPIGHFWKRTIQCIVYTHPCLFFGVFFCILFLCLFFWQTFPQKTFSYVPVFTKLKKNLFSEKSKKKIGKKGWQNSF